MKTEPIPFDNPASIAALEKLLAFHKLLQEQLERNATAISISEPTTPIERFNSASADTCRNLKQFGAAVENLLANAPMNQRLLNLLTTMKRNAEIFQANLESNILDIGREIDGFDRIEPRGDNKGESAW